MNAIKTHEKASGSLPFSFLCFLPVECERRLHEDGALKPFLLNRTAEFVRMADIPVKEIRVRMTAAAAIKARPAVAAERFVQHM